MLATVYLLSGFGLGLISLLATCVAVRPQTDNRGQAVRNFRRGVTCEYRM